MLNILAAECMKLRRNKLMLICTVIALILPCLLIADDIYQYKGTTPDDSVITWLFSQSLLCQLIIYPILSAFLLTFLIQKEYSDHTMINTITAPVKRGKFLTGKIIVWAVWHIVITLLYLGIVVMGVYLLFDSQNTSEFLSEITKMVLKIGMYNFCTLTPVIWIAVMQRKTFYPSLLCALIFSAIGFAGLYWPETISSIVPWSAVALLSAPEVDVFKGLAYTSISVCAFIGLFMSFYSFKHQEL